MSEELEKQAQAKLSEAWKLIHEAGELARQGQFYLHFGEVGDFIPSSFSDPEKLRERAIADLKAEGRYNGGESYDTTTNLKWVPGGDVKNLAYRELPRTPFSELSEDELEEAIEGNIESYLDEVPYEARTYGAKDTWWAPSRC